MPKVRKRLRVKEMVGCIRRAAMDIKKQIEVQNLFELIETYRKAPYVRCFFCV